MGIYDRDYYRNAPPSGFGSFRPWSVTTWLIIINVVVYFLDQFLQTPEGRPLMLLGNFSLASAVIHLQLWRFITYQFLHLNLSHIFYNMLGLYFFGPIVEGQFGPRRYLGFYLSCGIAGAVSYIILWAGGILIVNPNTWMVGASAAIFGVLIAAAFIAPDARINIFFLPISLTLRTLAWIAIALAVFVVMTQGNNAGGQAAHLGGAVWGYVLIRNQHWLNFLAPSRSRSSSRRQRRRVSFRDWTQDSNH